MADNENKEFIPIKNNYEVNEALLKLLNQEVDIDECRTSKQRRHAALHNNLVRAGCYDPAQIAELKRQEELNEKMRCMLLNNSNNQ